MEKDSTDSIKRKTVEEKFLCQTIPPPFLQFVLYKTFSYIFLEIEKHVVTDFIFEMNLTHECSEGLLLQIPWGQTYKQKNRQMDRETHGYEFVVGCYIPNTMIHPPKNNNFSSWTQCHIFNGVRLGTLHRNSNHSKIFCLDPKHVT